MFHSDTSGQGFWPEVSRCRAILPGPYLCRRARRALRTAVARWHAAPAGSRLLIVRTHLRPDELLACAAAFDEFGLKPHRVNFGGDLVARGPAGRGVTAIASAVRALMGGVTLSSPRGAPDA